MLCLAPHLSRIQTHNISGDEHWLIALVVVNPTTIWSRRPPDHYKKWLSIQINMYVSSKPICNYICTTESNIGYIELAPHSWNKTRFDICSWGTVFLIFIMRHENMKYSSSLFCLFLIIGSSQLIALLYSPLINCNLFDGEIHRTNEYVILNLIFFHFDAFSM